MTDHSKEKQTSEIIKTWVNLYSDSLFSWALHKTSDREVAEDLVQETFLAALQSYHRFEGNSQPKTWLMAILKNKILDHYRSNFKKPVALENSFLDGIFTEDENWNSKEIPQHWADDAHEIMDRDEFKLILSKCLKKLPLQWKTAIQLKYFEEKSGDEICQELDVTPTNFWQVIHRSKLQLRKCLEVNWFNKVA